MVTVSDELWQGYEDDGEPITDLGLTIRRASAGALHGSAHMWVWRQHEGDVQVLLQKRSSNSKTWPDFYDISAAGHLNFGEMPLHAAIRETKEELGITIRPEDAHLFFVHRQSITFVSANIIENEIQWVYGYDVTETPHFNLQSSEVNSVLWLGLDELSQLVAGNMKGMHIVPHDPAYFAELTRELVERDR
jgi:isopentenyldiphosphate isomerase